MRYRKFWLSCGFAFVLLVLYLSFTSRSVGGPKVADFGHVLAYAWLMFWFAQVCTSTAQRWATAAMLVLMGVAVEFGQGLTSYRTFDVMDMVSNAAGVGIGLALAATPLGRTLLFVERQWIAVRGRGPDR